MEADSWVVPLLLAATIVLLALIAAVEGGLATASRARTRLLVTQGVAKASLFQRYLQERQSLLGTLLLARNLTLVTSAALGVYLAFKSWGDSVLILVITLVVLLVALSLVQSLARSLIATQPERWGTRLYPILSAVKVSLGIPAYVLELPGRLLSRNGPQQEESEAEELLHLLEAEESAGAIEEDERRMIRGVINLVGTTAREIMVPRIDIVAVDSEATIDDAARVIIDRGYSRIPLYEGTIDNIIGILYAKDLLRYLASGDRLVSLRDIARRPYFIPETKKVDDLLAELRQRRVHIAVVVDEYGGTAGLVTIEDLLEEIVGEIEDEYDVTQVTVEKIADNEAVVDARLSIDALNDLLDLEIESGDFDTVGGFVYNHLGKMPAAGDEIRVAGLTLRVLSVAGRRIKKVHVLKEANQQANHPAGTTTHQRRQA